MSTPQDSSLFEGLLDLQSICNISEQRGKELLEATNGSLERAIDLHLFHQKGCTTSEGNHPSISSAECDIGLSSNRSDTDTIKTNLNINSPTESPKKRLKQDSLHPFFASTGSKSLPIAHEPSTIVKDRHCYSNDRLKPPPIECAIPTPPKNGKSGKMHQNLDTFDTMSFEHLANTLQTMSSTRKRTTKLVTLKEFILNYAQDGDKSRALRRMTCALAIILGRGTEERLGVSGRMVSSALQDSLGVSSRQLSKGYRQYGDLGDSAASFFQSNRYFVSTSQRRLSVVGVHQALHKVINADGNNEKKGMVSKLLLSCQSRNELRFMVRLLIGNMRIGCNLKTVLASVAMAFRSHSNNDNLNEKSAIQLVQKTHDICPDFEKILRALLLGGFEKLENDCKIQVFTPIAPMLANPTHSLEEIHQVMKQMQNSAVLEWKYDGVRCQAHCCHSDVKLFSRHLLETTEQYPDAACAILDARKKSQHIASFIIDAEIVAVEGEGERARLLPFQELATRKKKDDGSGVKIKVFCFDLMYLNGKSYVTAPLWKRRDLLRVSFNETNEFEFVTSKLLPAFNEQTIHKYLAESMRQGTEGLMVKMMGKRLLDQEESGDDGLAEGGAYEAGTRSQNWLKVKRDYVEGFADTIDVVPIGAWHGTGRKAENNFLSPILLAVYDEDDDVYRSICRCMTFTDAMYKATRDFYLQRVPYPAALSPVVVECEKVGSQTSELEDRCREGTSIVDEVACADSSNKEFLEFESSNCFANRPTSAFITNEKPPIWFKPLEVWEVSFADMSLSRQHTAGAGIVLDPDGRGIALRFPRFKRRRPDRSPDQATTSAQIASMFLKQVKQMKSPAL